MGHRHPGRDSGAPRRYVDYGNNGYSGYSSGYTSYADSRDRRRVPMADGRGGWVWGVRANCY